MAMTAAMPMMMPKVGQRRAHDVAAQGVQGHSRMRETVLNDDACPCSDAGVACFLADEAADSGQTFGGGPSSTITPSLDADDALGVARRRWRRA